MSPRTACHRSSSFETHKVRYTALAIAAVSAASLPGQGSRTALTPGTIAITHVNVVPMTSDTVLADRSVLVRDGRIVEVQPSTTLRVPAGARVIDGRGRYLVPGFADRTPISIPTRSCRTRSRPMSWA